jgi:hypothetical protein
MMKLPTWVRRAQMIVTLILAARAPAWPVDKQWRLMNRAESLRIAKEIADTITDPWEEDYHDCDDFQSEFKGEASRRHINTIGNAWSWGHAYNVMVCEPDPKPGFWPKLVRWLRRRIGLPEIEVLFIEPQSGKVHTDYRAILVIL